MTTSVQSITDNTSFYTKNLNDLNQKTANMTSHQHQNQQGSRPNFMRLPPELRLKIYQYALMVPNTYTNKPLIVIHDRGNVFTSRSRYRALSMCPSWEGEDGTARALLSVNRQIHYEAEDYLYKTHTLFFRNSFDLDRIGAFLDTLSATARSSIRSVGFEVFFFVHTDECVPKRTLKEYERARDVLRERLPNWKNVLCYLDPRFYYPAACVGGRELAARGVLDLAKRFGSLDLGLDVTFNPLPDSHHRLVEEAKQVIWRSSSPERRVSVEKRVPGGKMGESNAQNYPIALVG